MTTGLDLQNTLAGYVERRKDRLVEITRELVRIPSENTPPTGAEQACQQWIADRLSACSGLKPDVYSLNDVPGLHTHPLFVGGRDYTNRTNTAAVRKGTGSGRSLVLSGHVDTVPRGTQPWTKEPFSADVEGNRIYGRGSNDMKGGIATNLFVMESLNELKIQTDGDIIFESVADEEFGGCNGTLAGRLSGYNADAAIISEPSGLRTCPAQRGGRTAHITFRATGGVLQAGRFPAGTIPQLTTFLAKIPGFAAQRRSHVHVHEMYASHTDPVPVSVTKVFTAPWGFNEPITIPETAQIEFYWQLMPGEKQLDVDREFFDWLRQVVASEPAIFPEMPEVSFPIRWLPGSSIASSSPLVQELSSCAKAVLGQPPAVTGIEGPCDLFIFQQGFQMPAVLWGATGGNTHGADEYVEIDSLAAAAQTLLLFVCQWCGAKL